MRNIVIRVIPVKELLASQVALARRHLERIAGPVHEHDAAPELGRTPR
jgi:hypothetical protein